MGVIGAGIVRAGVISLLGISASISALPAQACWDQAASRYGLNSELLYAIARTESGLNPQAIGHNANGSRDIGLMQINSAWLPRLSTHGIQESDLLDACTSIHVGAWILAHNVRRFGNTWEAVGAYNATRPELRLAYAQRVYRHLTATRAQQSQGQSGKTATATTATTATAASINPASAATAPTAATTATTLARPISSRPNPAPLTASTQ